MDITLLIEFQTMMFVLREIYYLINLARGVSAGLVYITL